jgi:hypothetical protein
MGERWFRWSERTCEDPKWREVLDHLESDAPSHIASRVTLCDVLAVWACILEQASQYVTDTVTRDAKTRDASGDARDAPPSHPPSRDGRIKHQNDYVAATLMLERATVDHIWMAFEAVGLIRTDPFTTFVTNWNKRQFVDVEPTAHAKRQQRYRERKNQASRSVTQTSLNVTRDVQIQSTESDTESKKETRASPRANGHAILDGDVAEAFDLFWEEYPEKVGKPAARLKFPAALKRAGSIVVILDGLRRYKQRKPPDRAWLNPATFLHQDRWLDQPAAPARSSPRDVM